MANTALLQKALFRTSPELFGRYEVLGRIASGGMAEVLVARSGNVPGVQALVALKRMHPHLVGDKVFEDLFEREALISVRVQHETAPRVFEVGKVDGVWYMAMELIQAEPLWDVLKVVRLDPTLAVYIGARIAQVLDHVHDLRDTNGQPLGIVHRDVSPQNVLLAYEGHLKLIDFGVARTPVIGAATRARSVRGKLRYMSPEQALGGEVDARSDLFSLGILLHECLAGRPLFHRDDETRTVQAVLHEKAPALTQVSPEVARIVEKALEKNVRFRWQSAGELADALFSTLTRDDLLRGAERIGTLMTDSFPARLHRWRSLVNGAARGLEREIELSVHDSEVELRTPPPESAPPIEVWGPRGPETSPLFQGEHLRVASGGRARRRLRLRWPSAVGIAVGVAATATMLVLGWKPEVRRAAWSPAGSGDNAADNGPRVVQMPARARPAAAPPAEAPPVAAVEVAEVEVAEDVPPVADVEQEVGETTPAETAPPETPPPPVPVARKRATVANAPVVKEPAIRKAAPAPRPAARPASTANTARRAAVAPRLAGDDPLLRELEPSPYAKPRR